MNNHVLCVIVFVFGVEQHELHFIVIKSLKHKKNIEIHSMFVDNFHFRYCLLIISNRKKN